MVAVRQWPWEGMVQRGMPWTGLCREMFARMRPVELIIGNGAVIAGSSLLLTPCACTLMPCVVSGEGTCCLSMVASKGIVQ
jgi:hypothetical protein